MGYDLYTYAFYFHKFKLIDCQICHYVQDLSYPQLKLY